MMARFRMFAAALWAAGLVPFLVPADAQAAEASAGSAWWRAASDSDSGSVWFGSFSWSQTAQIKWTVPTFEADKTPLPTAPVPFNEPKFNTAANPSFPPAYTWNGFSITGTGPAGSTVSATGRGSSSTGLFYGAAWSVTATGTGDYHSVSQGDDPFQIFPDDLAGLNDSFRLFVPIGLLGGSLGSGNVFEAYQFSAFYGSMAATHSFLTVAVSRAGPPGAPIDVSVVTNPSFGGALQFLLLGGLADSPVGSSLPGAVIAAADLETLIRGNVDAAGNWLAPLHIAAVLSGVPKPTSLFPDGSVAFTGAAAMAASAGVPEPSAWLMMMLGFGTMGMALRRRRVPAGAAVTGD